MPFCLVYLCSAGRLLNGQAVCMHKRSTRASTERAFGLQAAKEAHSAFGRRRDRQHYAAVQTVCVECSFMVFRLCQSSPELIQFPEHVGYCDPYKLQYRVSLRQVNAGISRICFCLLVFSCEDNIIQECLPVSAKRRGLDLRMSSFHHETPQYVHLLR